MTPRKDGPRRTPRLVLLAAGVLAAPAAYAQTAPATPAPATPAPAAAPATVTLPAPAMSAPLALSATPYALDVGPLGKWYVSGALTGLGIVQSNAAASDNGGQADLSNGQIIVQKIDGVIQFFAEAGGYTFPALGTAYVPVSKALGDYFSGVPIAYAKLVPSSALSISAGKLPTLVGAEGIFTFQNMNIERGLLWNQEPVISRGAQLTYVKDTVTVNVSLNDGYYSNVYNWVSGSLAWAMNSASTLSFVGAGNLGHTNVATFATPLPQNNSSIFNVIYTFSHGPWTVTPYFQASFVKADAALGFGHAADTYGGALLANYALNANWSLAGRVEYITTTGSAADGAPNLLYGPGSKAFSLTFTPTWQYNRFFVRGDVSYVTAASITPGDGFGRSGTGKDQVRGVIEAGVLF